MQRLHFNQKREQDIITVLELHFTPILALLVFVSIFLLTV
jgi:hypothetical protein